MHRTHKTSPGSSVFKRAEQTFSRLNLERVYPEARERMTTLCRALHWSSRSRWSALRTTNVIGRTLIASTASDDAGGGQKVSGKRKDPLASRYSGLRVRERPSGIFSYYLEATIHLSSHFPRFSSTLPSALCTHRRRVVPSFVRGSLDIGFSNSYHESGRQLPNTR